MVHFFRYIANSKLLVVLLPTVIFVGFFVFLKFFFVLFSDCHQLKVSTPSEKIVSTIRKIGKNDSTKIQVAKDSINKSDNYYDQKETYNIGETRKDTMLRKMNK